MSSNVTNIQSELIKAIMNMEQPTFVKSMKTVVVKSIRHERGN